ncbi:MAG: hypothetical protein AAFQ67_02255 [Pseudomonadota bacterium]
MTDWTIEVVEPGHTVRWLEFKSAFPPEVEAVESVVEAEHLVVCPRDKIIFCVAEDESFVRDAIATHGAPGQAAWPGAEKDPNNG